MLAVQSEKKQIITQKLLKLTRNLLIIIMNKYINTPEFNKFTAEVFDVRLARANLITKTDFSTKLISLNQKNISNKIKQLPVENELKIQTFDSIY